MNEFPNIVMDDGWFHPLAKTLPSLVNNLWWNIGIGDWNLDDNTLSCDNNRNIESIIPFEYLQGATNNVELTYIVGDAIPWFTISVEQDN